MADMARPPSPGQTVGPFFHFGLIYPGSHEIVGADTAGAIHLRGTVRDGNGDPVPDALIEIWQPGPDGSVVDTPGHIARDGQFTGFGRSATDDDGQYWFRTHTPGPATEGGAAFFAVTVFARGLMTRLFTRAYVPSDALGADPLLTGIEPARRTTLIASIEEGGDLRFDIAMQGPDETVFLDFDSSKSGMGHHE